MEENGEPDGKADAFLGYDENGNQKDILLRMMQKALRNYVFQREQHIYQD